MTLEGLGISGGGIAGRVGKLRLLGVAAGVGEGVLSVGDEVCDSVGSSGRTAKQLMGQGEGEVEGVRALGD